SGRPYFVMELVKGVPINEYCDRNRLTPRERLELFVPVCQAIQHAHQKGIIHRDIKPSNILVTVYDGKPVPKVIDFGIAKAIAQRLTERTMFTQFGSIVGTLEYMSPEQAGTSALGVDTRSDIYSLGVLLYELLTGTTPLDRAKLRETAYVEILRRICEEEPPRPSTRLSDSKATLPSISAQRRTEPTRLAKLLRGDLDWIVMKSLEKDRTRRYESASGLARDIERHLEGDAVEACPPSAGYRLRKFVRKHRGALATATALVMTLVSAVVISTWQAIRALRSAAESKAVLAFVEDQFLIAARPQGQSGGLGKDVTLRQAVDAAEPKIQGSFPDQPIVEALVRDCLGNTYDYVGEPELGIKQHERAVQLLQANLGPRNPNTIIARANLAGSCLGAGRPAEAIPLFEESLELGTSTLGADHPDTLKCQSGLAVAYWRTGQLDRSIPLFERVLKRTAAKLGPDHPHTLTTQANLGINYRDAGRPADGARLMEEALRRARNHPDVRADMAWVTSELAMTYLAAGQLDKAESILRESAEQVRKQFGAEDPRRADAIDDLAFGLLKRQNWVEAESLLRECLAIREKGQPDDWRTFNTRSRLGASLFAQKRFAEAEKPIVSGYQGMKLTEARSPAAGKARMSEAARWVVELYEAWGQKEKAAEWRAKLAAGATNG
ncbi:MAG TPA: serine/threonine-protein kinase, partial [Isosphaeraceae bacterium]|nr:serine/threonine-protein kinase [Isosphaeraceae bacterium]